MRGHRNIAASFGLASVKDRQMGAFDWMHRMGVHLAFHRAKGNILLHLIMPPVNALGIFLMLYPIQLSEISLVGEPVTLAVVALVATFVVMARVDLLAALLTGMPMLLLYLTCNWVFQQVGESTLWMMITGAVLFLAALWVQVAIGHGVYENGIGDEDENIGELFESKNPIYFILLPLYQTLELMFLLGYRKGTADYVFGIMRELRPQVEKRKSENPASKGI